MRQTFEGGNALVVGWSPVSEVLLHDAPLLDVTNTQLARVNPARDQDRGAARAASDGTFDSTGRTLYFTRLAFQGSYTKRYQGGTAQNLWRFASGDKEATALTADYKGTSKSPMLWNGRVYFLSDRDGTMNLWSMAERGGDLKQHTRHSGFDAALPSVSEGQSPISPAQRPPLRIRAG